MNCRRCHHTGDAHESSATSRSIIKMGRCMIPNCTCKEYREPIEEIDEELL